MTASEPLVRLAVVDGVATITLDHQEKRNALSRRLVQELFAALDAAEADETATVVLLRAAGKVFCAGADLSEASEQGMAEGTRAIVELQRRITASPKPVVAVVEGAVRAGGLGLVAAADVALVADDVTFALTEVRLGLAAATISLTVLPRLPSRQAARWFLTGETFGAAEAAASGLVTAAVPRDDLPAMVERLLADLRKGHPQGLREAKRLVNAHIVAGIERDGEAMAELSERLFASDAAREAMLAFLQRSKG